MIELLLKPTPGMAVSAGLRLSLPQEFRPTTPI